MARAQESLPPPCPPEPREPPYFARVLHPCLPPLLRQYVVEHPPRFGRSHLRGSRATFAVAATGKATGKLQPRLWVVPLFVWPCYITPEEHSLEPGKHLKSYFDNGSPQSFVSTSEAQPSIKPLIHNSVSWASRGTSNLCDQQSRERVERAYRVAKSVVRHSVCALICWA